MPLQHTIMSLHGVTGRLHVIVLDDYYYIGLFIVDAAPQAFRRATPTIDITHNDAG